MQEGRVLKTGVAEFQQEKWSGKNESGFSPIGDRIMVLPDTVNEQTTGGIFLPGESQERQRLAATSGIIIALGPEAFHKTENGRDWPGKKPEVGSHVYFERYAGQVLEGHDNRIYRLMDASCIGAVAVQGADPCQM